MVNQDIQRICEYVNSVTGVSLKGFLDKTGKRKGLSFWFKEYTRRSGPLFSIRPAGLKGYVVSLSFGPYAEPCIDHISKNASREAYVMAYAFIDGLQQRFDVKLNGIIPSKEWVIGKGYDLSVSKTRSKKNDDAELFEVVDQVLLPIITFMAELIGYEEPEIEDIEGDVEGAIAEVVILKRERSPRNRLLCLSLHGDYCGICGINPKDIYDGQSGEILEVHHIEPLSEIDIEKQYDPTRDLIPLCPNCHRAVHKKKPAYLPTELKEIINQ